MYDGWFIVDDMDEECEWASVMFVEIANDEFSVHNVR